MNLCHRDRAAGRQASTPVGLVAHELSDQVADGMRENKPDDRCAHWRRQDRWSTTTAHGKVALSDREMAGNLLEVIYMFFITRQADNFHYLKLRP